jgi:hypothetical protein
MFILTLFKELTCSSFFFIKESSWADKTTMLSTCPSFQIVDRLIFTEFGMNFISLKRTTLLYFLIFCRH